jgi:hypothetical protein
MLALGLIFFGLVLLIICFFLIKSFTGSRHEPVERATEVDASNEHNLVSWEHSNSLEVADERSDFPILKDENNTSQ